MDRWNIIEKLEELASICYECHNACHYLPLDPRVDEQRKVDRSQVKLEAIESAIELGKILRQRIDAIDKSMSWSREVTANDVYQSVDSKPDGKL